ncbi:histidine--tRNA ligase [Eremococcus coleocola]|uniref:histidine--tRNA ligase n=1 Tax=Eremococcus coleocola TaxID=88132 RepID=UPI00042985CD|nr:histidine--tRNA ligase [Eremococcus coleocola]
MIQKIKGAEDLLADKIPTWHYVEDTARTIFEAYNFKEIRTPMIENFELFSRSVGESTDIVSKEMYDFEDKGGRRIALRPEGTAPVVRAFVEHKLFGPEYPQPYKAYYIGPMFRYERPQAGRQRQFHQIGMEVFGSSNPATDAEGIAMAWDLLSELGLENLTIHLNSLGKTPERMAYRQALIDYFTPHLAELSEDSQRRLHDNPLRVLDSKDPKDKVFVKDAPTILDYLSEESKAHFQAVQNYLTDLEIPFQINPYVVRGLDYYQDTIFEIMVEDESIGAQSTVAGGGRYDGLVQELGGPEVPGFGFALGVERLILVMEHQAVEIPAEDGLDLFVLLADPEANSLALQVLQAARQDGLIADRDFMNRSLKSQFKTAAKNNASLVTTLGGDEVASKMIRLKNQESGKEAEFSLDELIEDFAGIYRQMTMDTSAIDDFFKGV